MDNFHKPQQLQKENNWSTLTQTYPNQEDIDRTNEINKEYKGQTGQELTMLDLKMHVILMAKVFENFVITYTAEYKINP